MKKGLITMALVLGIGAMSGISVYGVQPTKGVELSQSLKKEIKTKEQAIKKLDQMFPSLWHSYHLWHRDTPVATLRSGQAILAKGAGSEAGRSDMATAVAYLLSDNHEVGTLYGFNFGEDATFMPIKAANYIKIKGKYHIFDPVVGTQADQTSRKGAIFETQVLDSLEQFGTWIKNHSELRANVSQVYAVPNGQEVRFTVDPNQLIVTVDQPANAKLLYSNTKLAEGMFDHIKAEAIGKYRLPKLLGGLTLTQDQAKALVGQKPEVIKDQVRTAGDMLLYMLASRTLLEDGDQVIWADGYEWHYNRTALEVLERRRGNCGSSANLANYLLADDYEELGFILHSYAPGNGGGHVYNYIKYEGMYYIVDFSSYLFNNYSVQNEFNVIGMKKLSDYKTRWKECFGGVVAIVAHESPSRHLPNVWSGNNYYLPAGAKYQVILETPGTGYAVKPLPMPHVVPN